MWELDEFDPDYLLNRNAFAALPSDIHADVEGDQDPAHSVSTYSKMSGLLPFYQLSLMGWQATEKKREYANRVEAGSNTTFDEYSYRDYLMSYFARADRGLSKLSYNIASEDVKELYKIQIDAGKADTVGPRSFYNKVRESNKIRRSMLLNGWAIKDIEAAGRAMIFVQNARTFFDNADKHWDEYDNKQTQAEPSEPRIGRAQKEALAALVEEISRISTTAPANNDERKNLLSGLKERFASLGEILPEKMLKEFEVGYVYYSTVDSLDAAFAATLSASEAAFLGNADKLQSLGEKYPVNENTAYGQKDHDRDMKRHNNPPVPNGDRLENVERLDLPNVKDNDPAKRYNLESAYSAYMKDKTDEELQTCGRAIMQAINSLNDNIKNIIPADERDELRIRDLLGNRAELMYEEARNMAAGTSKGEKIPDILKNISDISNLYDNSIFTSILRRAAGNGVNIEDYRIQRKRDEIYRDFVAAFGDNLKSDFGFTHVPTPGEAKAYMKSREESDPARMGLYERKIQNVLFNIISSSSTKDDLWEKIADFESCLNSPYYNELIRLSTGRDFWHEAKSAIDTLSDPLRGMSGYARISDDKKLELFNKVSDIAKRLTNADTFKYFPDRMDDIANFMADGAFKGKGDSTLAEWGSGTIAGLEKEIRRKNPDRKMPNPSTRKGKDELLEEIMSGYRALDSFDEKIKYLSEYSQIYDSKFITTETKEALEELPRLVCNDAILDAEGVPDKEKIRNFCKNLGEFTARAEIARGGHSDAVSFFKKGDMVLESYGWFQREIMEEINSALGYIIDDPKITEKDGWAIVNHENKLKIDLPEATAMVKGYTRRYLMSASVSEADRAKWEAFNQDAYLRGNIKERGFKKYGAGDKDSFLQRFTSIACRESAVNLMKRHGKNLFIGQDEVDLLQALQKNLKAAPAQPENPEYTEMLEALAIHIEATKKVASSVNTAPVKAIEAHFESTDRLVAATEDYLKKIKGLGPRNETFIQAALCLYATDPTTYFFKNRFNKDDCKELNETIKERMKALRDEQKALRTAAERKQKLTAGFELRGSVLKERRLETNKKAILNYIKKKESGNLFNHTGTLEKLEREFISAEGDKKAAVRKMGAILNKRYAFGPELSKAVARQVYDRINAAGAPLDHKKYNDSTKFVQMAVDFAPSNAWRDFSISAKGDNKIDVYRLKATYRPEITKRDLNDFKAAAQGVDWNADLDVFLTNPDRMDRIQEMFVTKKAINVNSNEYKQAKSAFKNFQQTRNDLMKAIRKGKAEEAGRLYNAYKQGVEDLGIRMAAYHSHLGTEENGTEIDKKGSYAGMARLSAADITIEEMKAVSGKMSKEFNDALKEKKADVKSVTFAALYENVMREKNENVDGKRHKTAAKAAGEAILGIEKKTAQAMR